MLVAYIRIINSRPHTEISFHMLSFQILQFLKSEIVIKYSLNIKITILILKCTHYNILYLDILGLPKPRELMYL